MRLPLGLLGGVVFACCLAACDEVARVGATPDHGHLPELGARALYVAGDFTLSPGAHTGQATFREASLLTSGQALGTGRGDFSIGADAGLRSAEGGTAGFEAVVDERGRTLALIVARATVNGEARALFVAVPYTEVQAGRTLHLDGTDRVALYASGPAGGTGSTFAAAATGGRLTIDAIVGGKLSATLVADFARIELDLPDMAVVDGGLFASGTWTLAFQASPVVMCGGGGLAGHEPDFATYDATTARLTAGPVELIAGKTEATLSGAAILSSFGVDPMTLTVAPDDPEIYYGAGSAAADPQRVAPNGLVSVGATLAVRHDNATDHDLEATAIVVYTDDPTGATGNKCLLVFAAHMSR